MIVLFFVIAVSNCANVDRFRRQIQPVRVVQMGNNVDFFPPAPPPLDQFVPVYLPMPDPSTLGGMNTGPTVIPIILGDLQMSADQYRFPSSVVLVRDGPNCDMVVDTGTALYKNTIVGGLAAHQIKLDAINNVILTHNDVDNMGNLNLFYGIRVLSGTKQWVRDTVFEQSTPPGFQRPGVQLPSRSICANTDLYQTPGYTVNDLTLVVRNVRDFGTIAITGNLFMNEADVSDRNIWQRFSNDVQLRNIWETTRREILCLADYIIPGHGQTFRVSRQMKDSVRCGMQVRSAQTNIDDSNSTTTATTTATTTTVGTLKHVDVATHLTDKWGETVITA